MLTTPHALVAAFIVYSVPNKFVGLVLAFLSHLMLDFFVPHWNPHLYTEIKTNKKISKQSVVIIIADALLANLLLLVIAFYLALPLRGILYLWTGAFFGVLPDLIEIPYYFLNNKNKYLVSYINWEHHNQSNGTFLWGIITQLLISLTALQSFFRL